MSFDAMKSYAVSKTFFTHFVSQIPTSAQTLLKSGRIFRAALVKM